RREDVEMQRPLSRSSQSLGLLFTAAMLFATALAVSAQDYPTKAVRIVVPFAPGGGSDFIARFMGQRLGEALGKALRIENKRGAGGNLGTEQGVRAAADGYTLVLIASSYTVNPAIHKINFDPVNDITPIIQLSRGPLLVLVNPSLGVNTLKDLIALATR